MTYVDTAYILNKTKYIPRGDLMYTTIQKWGNSQAIRLPKKILEVVNLQENDKVEVIADNDRIIIKPLNKKHKTFEERIAGYDGDYKCTEWDTGEPKGKEVW